MFFRNRTYRFVTVGELAKLLYEADFDERIDFTLDENEDWGQHEPTGWYGTKKVKLFDEDYGCIAVGNFGGCDTVVEAICYNDVDNIERILGRLLPEDVSVVCIEVPAKELWEEFGDVPMNPETECIEEDWNGFEAGTHREDIWHWFESNYDLSVAEDLMYM